MKNVSRIGKILIFLLFFLYLTSFIMGSGMVVAHTRYSSVKTPNSALGFQLTQKDFNSPYNFATVANNLFEYHPLLKALNTTYISPAQSPGSGGYTPK